MIELRLVGLIDSLTLDAHDQVLKGVVAEPRMEIEIDPVGLFGFRPTLHVDYDPAQQLKLLGELVRLDGFHSLSLGLDRALVIQLDDVGGAFASGKVLVCFHIDELVLAPEEAKHLVLLF